MTMGPDKEAADELRMSAYYYGFTATGIPDIDRILSAVACAGKAFHHTEDWHQEAEPFRGHAGSNPIEWIQNAANDAAKAASEIAALRRRAQQMEGALKPAIAALEEAEAILGGEYGDHYGVLCELMIKLKTAAKATLSPARSDNAAPLKPEGGT